MLFTDITQATAMTNDDVLYVLREQDMISTPDSVSGRMRAPATAKYKSRDGSSVAATTPRGGSSRRGRGGGPAADRKTKEDALAVPSEYRIHLDRDYINAHIKNYEAKNYVKVKPEKLKWTPFLVTRAVTQPPVPAASASHDRVNGAEAKRTNGLENGHKEGEERDSMDVDSQAGEENTLRA